MEASNIKELIITDTIPLAEEKKSSKIKILSVAPVFAEAIELIYGQKSVSKLFR